MNENYHTSMLTGLTSLVFVICILSWQKSFNFDSVTLGRSKFITCLWHSAMADRVQRCEDEIT